ncbi:hypothetical protein NHQ30_009626 [Ciborinia camelliae]|nr:hypothetical protein NHQ30_009626 [Ciborinia camelliae]
MALEVIGGIASIAQLAATVYTISKTLYEVGEALSNAPSDIKDLARDLETFSDELHLLSTLLHGKDGRYADQVYRLTAKIIGDCATICTKIDRVIRKLRSGSFWGKVKWLYKEKEIMKLLARLRDLKLSLMGTLSVLSALRADHMMDSLGIQNSSLIGGQNGHGLSAETRKEVEDTRLKLAGIKIMNVTKNCQGSTTMSNSSSSLLPKSSSSALSLSATSTTYIGSSASRTANTASFNPSPFISMATIPNSMPMLNQKALESVDSFHSALSYQNQGSSSSAMQAATTPNAPSDQIPNEYGGIAGSQFAVMSSSHGRPAFKAEGSHHLNRSPKVEGESLKIWRNEMAVSAVKHFYMNKADAEEWAMRLPVPRSQKLPTQYPTQSSKRGNRPQSATFNPQELATSVYDSPIQSQSLHASTAYAETDPYTTVEPTYEPCSIITHQDLEMTGGSVPLTLQPPVAERREDEAETPTSSVGDAADFQAAMGFAGLNKTKIGSILKDSTPERRNDGGEEPFLPPPINMVAQRRSLERCLPQSPGFPSPSVPKYQLQAIGQVIRSEPRKVLEMNLSTTAYETRTAVYDVAPPGYNSSPVSPKYRSEERDRKRAQHDLRPDLYEGPGPENETDMEKQKGEQGTIASSSAQYDRTHSTSLFQSRNGKDRRLSEPVVLGGSNSPGFNNAHKSPVPEKRNNNDLNGWSGTIDPSKKNTVQNFAQFHREREEHGNKSNLGGLWLKALQNVKSNESAVWEKLQQFLDREHVATTTEAGSDPLVKNSHWPAKSHKENFNASREIYPDAAGSLQRILDVLAVVEETIGLKIGVIAWACLLSVVENVLSPDINLAVQSRVEIIDQLAEVASMIARYTVMENIYAQWKGMSLDKLYEEALIEFSTQVLIYFGNLLSPPAEEWPDLARNIKFHFRMIMDADKACRGFTVIISTENTTVDQKRSIEDISDDTDDTDDLDGTMLGGDEKDVMRDIPSPAKRIRI